MKTNLRILLQKRRVKPEVWCRDNGIRTRKQLEQFLASSNYMVDQPLENWVKFEAEIVVEKPKPVEVVLEQPTATEEAEEPTTEKPKRQNKKPKATDTESQPV